MSDKFDFISATDKPALLAFSTPEWLETAELRSDRTRLQGPHRGDARRFLVRFSQIRYQVVIVEELFAANDISENLTLQALQAMPMGQRRHATVILFGNSFQTFTPMQAFQQSVHAVINTSELFLLKQLIEKAVADNNLFLHSFREAHTRAFAGAEERSVDSLPRDDSARVMAPCGSTAEELFVSSFNPVPLEWSQREHFTAMPRVDQALVERGLCESREKAKRLILAGQVRINGATGPQAQRPGQSRGHHSPCSPRKIRQPRRPQARTRARGISTSRAGLTAIDLGASTGGFTDCLLQRGAKGVCRGRGPGPACLEIAPGPAGGRDGEDQRPRTHPGAFPAALCRQATWW